MPRKKYYFDLDDLKAGYPNAMVAEYGLSGDEVYVWAENGFAAETEALEEYKQGRWKTRKNGGKIRDSILVEFSFCGAVILVLDLVGVIV